MTAKGPNPGADLGGELEESLKVPILVDLEGVNLGGPISEGGKFEDGSKVPILVDLEGADLGDRIYGSRVDRICRGTYAL